MLSCRGISLRHMRKIEIHYQEEAAVVMLNSPYESIYAYQRSKLLPYLPYSSLFSALTLLPFAAGKLPVSTPFTIASFGDKNLSLTHNDGGTDSYLTHEASIEQKMSPDYNPDVMKKSVNYDLGRDGLWFLTLHLALPTALAQAVNVLYAIVDRMFIGHIAGYGDVALAGVGIAAPVTTLISSFAVLIGMGGAPIMAMKEGHGEHESARRILSTAFYLIIIASAVLTPLFLIFREPVLMAFGASGSTISYASEYLGWYVLGTPFALLASGLNSFIINQGKSKSGMVSVLTGAALNIVLDPIFIFVFGLGVRGAAIATVLSQIASCAVVIGVLLSRKTQIRLHFGMFDRQLTGKIITFGLSPFIIIATDSVLMIVLNSVLQRYGGPETGDILITCSTIIQSYHLLVMNPLGGITAGCQGLVSFNYGAGNSTRVRGSIRRVQIVATAYTVIMFMLTMAGSHIFASFFTPDASIQRLAAKYMMIFEAMIIPLSFQYNNVDMMTALGQVRFSLPLSLTRKLIFFLSTLALPALFSADAAFFAEPVCDLLAGTISTIIMWKELPKILRAREQKGFSI